MATADSQQFAAANPRVEVTDKPEASPLPGIKVLLMGGMGSGKTSALKTLIDAGITPMAIFTENSFDVLGNVPKDKIHWKYIPPSQSNVQVLIDSAKKLTVMTPAQIQAMSDMTRAQNNQWMPVLESMMNYKCDRTGQSFGNVSSWGTDKALVFDSLSGLTIAATKMAVGEKYAMTQPEYQLVMKTLENFINQICTGFHCHVVLTAHLERELDEVNGGVKLFASTIGRKLAPVIGRNFTDVIIAKRNGAKFIWDSADPQADLKTRNAPISAELPASFLPLVNMWKSRGGVISPSTP
jgi:Ni2+-binding GTPase involved in maturation of urease and hydrogenase